MTDKARPSKPDAGTPITSSRASGSIKGEAVGARPLSRGRRNLKPEAGSDERVELRRGKGPVKAEGRELKPRLVGRKEAKPTGTKATTRTDLATDRGRQQDELPDQIPVRRRGGSGEGQGRYVRFRMRVDDGKMSIVDSQLVDSPLMMPPVVSGAFAYEVTDGARLLHADTIPDLGVVRSFANPNGTREQLRHHIYRESTYEFDVRVPAEELTTAALSKIAVVLYRVKDREPIRLLTKDAPLGAQLVREVREVTRVSRIPAAALPSELRPTRRPRT